MVNMNSSHRSIQICQKARFEGRFYIVYSTTTTVPINLMLTMFPTLEQHRVVKFPTQGWQIIVKPRGYARYPWGNH